MRTRRSIDRQVRLLVAAATLSLLTGCVKMDVRLLVTSRDTVSGTMVVAVDKELLAMSGQTVDEALGGAAASPPGLANVEISDYEDESFVGKRMTFQDTSLDAFNESDGTSGDNLVIVRDGDAFRLNGTLDLTMPDDQSEGRMIQGAMKSAELNITVTFPGRVRSSNGEIDGNTVSWTPMIGKLNRFSAVAEALPGASSSSSTLWVIVGFTAAAIAIASVVAIRRGRRGDSPAPPVPAEPVDDVWAWSGATPLPPPPETD